MERPKVEELRGYLRNEMLHSAEARFIIRMQSVLLIGLGARCEEVAKWFSLNVNTIERWVGRYRIDGVKGLREQKKPGRPKELGDDQLKRLSHDVTHHPRVAGYFADKWTGSLLQYHIRRQYGKSLSLRQSQRILHDLNERGAG
jgi:transposase